MIMLINAVVALVPLLVGFVWYNPKVFGNAWMASIGKTSEELRGANMALVFGLTYLFSFFLAVELNAVVIHQFGLFSLFQPPAGHTPDLALHTKLLELLNTYHANFRTYKHGAFHGFILGLTIALPIIGVNALFERKGFKYIAINVGYWTLCTTIMGALLCHFQDVSFMYQ